MKANKTIKIGIFVSIVIALSIWGLYFLKHQNPFKNENHYIILYDDIEGLNQSSPVVIRGLRVGQVTSITFSNSTFNQLSVDIVIDSKIQLREGTIAKIFSSDLMGTKSIEVIAGNGEKILHDSDTLKADIEENIREQVKLQMLPLKNKAESLMGSMDSVLAQVEYIFNNNTKENIKTSILNIRKTFENLEHSTSKIDTLVSNNNINAILFNVESITATIRNHNKEIGKIISNLSVFSDSLTKIQLAVALQKASLTLSEIESIISKVNNGEGTLGMLLKNDTLYRNLSSAAAGLDSLLIDIKKNPNRYVQVSVFGQKNNARSRDKKKEIDK